MTGRVAPYVLGPFRSGLGPTDNAVVVVEIREASFFVRPNLGIHDLVARGPGLLRGCGQAFVRCADNEELRRGQRSWADWPKNREFAPQSTKSGAQGRRGGLRSEPLKRIGVWRGQRGWRLSPPLG